MSKHISQYAHVIGIDMDAIDRLMDAVIHNGWQPYGNLVIDPRTREFIQPIVRYGDEPQTHMPAGVFWS